MNDSRSSINVLLFGPLAEKAGAPSLQVAVAGPLTVSELLAALERQAPTLGGLQGTVAVAVDGAYAALTTQVTAAHEVALIPPVSGG